jgi:2-polyprenyl-6-hydroxyphenyl methylase/3-demethylubiquinone-9 3-methyltransferase
MEREVINNAFYDELGERWYEGGDHPIALLRAENEARIPWVIDVIVREKTKSCRILDIGCGAGLLANKLALAGHEVVGVDLSAPSLAVARAKDKTKSVEYLQADVTQMPFPEGSLEVICAMDFLEHIEDFGRVIEEVGRLLRPGGLFFFHTFNRTPLSWLFAVKGVEWFVKNAPKHLHLYRLFIKPAELRAKLQLEKMEISQMHGLMPVKNRAFLKMLLTRHVGNGFSFQLTSSLSCGYLGYAKRK